MATQAKIVAYFLEQAAAVGSVTAKQMFGEYGIYCDGKIVALLCDDELYIKPTPAAESYLGEVERKPPYPGAKDYFLVTADLWEDREWLCELLRVNAQALPKPVPKKSPKHKLGASKKHGSPKSAA